MKAINKKEAIWSLNSIEYFETLFSARNFQHLTGIHFTDLSGRIITNRIQFYNKCIHNRLSESEIHFKSDGTTELKLNAFPQIIHFLNFSRMTAQYNNCRPKLTIDRLVGTTNFCLGFTYDSRGYYVPSSSLLEDIRKLSNESCQIFAILSKPASGSQPLYTDIDYVAKNVSLTQLSLPHTLKSLIALS